MNWRLSHRADQEARVIADRHYNRQKPGTPQFVPPGRCMVLKTDTAFWVTSWPYAEWVQHAWGGAWLCSAFRNEGKVLSSQLIEEAVACTRWFWRTEFVPAKGFITFVDSTKVRPKLHVGYCYLRAGFLHIGYTKAGLYVFHLPLSRMPLPAEPCV